MSAPSWRYKFLDPNSPEFQVKEMGESRYGEKLLERMNLFGSNGYELVCIFNGQFIFKRQVG